MHEEVILRHPVGYHLIDSIQDTGQQFGLSLGDILEIEKDNCIFTLRLQKYRNSGRKPYMQWKSAISKIRMKSTCFEKNLGKGL